MVNDRKDTMPETTGNGAAKKAAARKPPAEKSVDEALLEQQAAEEAAERRALSEEESEAAERDEAPALASNLGKLEILTRLWMHAHAGEEQPSDEEILAMEDKLTAPPEPAPVVPDLPDDIEDDLPPSVMAILKGQAAQQAALTQALELLAEKVAGSRGTELQVSLGSGGESAEQLLKQMIGTVDDGGDGEDPLPRAVTFVSKGAMFKAIKKPRYRGVGPSGEQFFTTGTAADFAPHGQFVTKNREMVAWLKARPGFGTEFWEQGLEPFSAPDPSVMLGLIMDAMLALDDVELEKLESEEKASHKRKVVLDALQQARNRVQRFAAAEVE